jgi:dihydrolipoamide dehydrogenase
MLQGLGASLLTNDSVFELPALPQSLAVFGSGVLGMELAQAMSRLGVHVQVFGVGGGIAGIRDPEMRDYAQKTFNEEMYVDPSATVRSVRQSPAGVEVDYLHRDGSWRTDRFERVLAATGRTPDLGRLALENTGLELDARGVPVFDRLTMQCGASPVFIAGDASADAPLLHEAVDQGRLAGENAAVFPAVRPGLRRIPMAVVFTDPQVATVGMTLDRLQREFGDRFSTGQVSFENQGRSRVMLRNKGLLKVYAERDGGRFLGAEMFGPAAEHLAHLLAWAAQQRMTVTDMLRMPIYHPVIEEAVRTALRDLDPEPHSATRAMDRCIACGPGD